jgi:hypothetical protein
MGKAAEMSLNELMRKYQEIADNDCFGLDVVFKTEVLNQLKRGPRNGPMPVGVGVHCERGENLWCM